MGTYIPVSWMMGFIPFFPPFSIKIHWEFLGESAEFVAYCWSEAWFSDRDISTGNRKATGGHWIVPSAGNPKIG